MAAARGSCEASSRRARSCRSRTTEPDARRRGKASCPPLADGRQHPAGDRSEGMSEAVVPDATAPARLDDARIEGARHLVAFEQCGIELQAPHLRTRKKRRIEAADVDVDTLGSDSLRFVGWAEDELIAVFPDLDPDARYELEATLLCERGVRRVVGIRANGADLHPPTELARGTATVIRAVVPQWTY